MIAPKGQGRGRAGTGPPLGARALPWDTAGVAAGGNNEYIDIDIGSLLGAAVRLK